jgi:hypothetical protein
LSSLLSFAGFFGLSRCDGVAEIVFPENGLKKKICGDRAENVFRPDL